MDEAVVVSRLSLFERTPPRRVLAVSVRRQPWQTWFLLRFFKWVTRPLRFYLSIFDRTYQIQQQQTTPKVRPILHLCTKSFIQWQVDWRNGLRYHRNLNFKEDRRSLLAALTSRVLCDRVASVWLTRHECQWNGRCGALIVESRPRRNPDLRCTRIPYTLRDSITDAWREWIGQYRVQLTYSRSFSISPKCWAGVWVCYTWSTVSWA